MEYVLDFFAQEINVNVTFTVAFGISQILALVSLISACISTWGSHKHLVIALIVDSAALTLSYILLGAWSGAVCNILCLIRHGYCLLKEKYPTLNRRWILWLFLILHLVIGLAVESITINPLLCLLPIAAAYLSTIGAWFEEEKISKILIASMYAVWLVYDCVIFTPIGIVNDALPFACSLWGLFIANKSHTDAKKITITT